MTLCLLFQYIVNVGPLVPVSPPEITQLILCVRYTQEKGMGACLSESVKIKLS